MNDDKYRDHSAFFTKCGDEFIHPVSFHGARTQSVTIEEMYQHFKARLISELAVNSEELLYSAEIIDAKSSHPKGLK